MRLQRRNKSVRLNGHYDRLEDRRLLAGDVVVFEHQGSLFIRGDSADNQVQILGTENGDIVVSGLNGTTLNGRNEVISLSDRGAQISQDLRVHLGKGNDSLFVEGIQVNHRAVVYGGSGNDSVGFYKARILDDLFGNLSWGDDNFSLDEVEVGDNLVVFGLEGNDTIGIDQSLVSGKTYIVGGHDHDRVAVSNSRHVEGVAIFGNGGDDFVGTNGLIAESRISLLMGSGNDEVFINDSEFQSHVFAIGERGHDSLEVAGSTTFAFAPFVRSFEGDVVFNGAERTSQVYTDLIVAGARLGTITELAVLTPELSTLVGALQATGLDAALNGPGPFTAFAPLNSAFDKLPEGTLASLTLQQLTDILTFHVSSDVIFAADLVQLSEVNTLLGVPFSVDTTNGVVLNGNVTLAAVDIRAKNGVIHLLNEVLIPA